MPTKYNNIKSNTVKAETITSSTPRKERFSQAPIQTNASTGAPTNRGGSSIQSFSPSTQSQTPTPPPVPKQDPPNLAQLAHNPGAISSQKRIEAQTFQAPVEDIITARIVGTDFRSGQAKVQDGSGNTYDVLVGSAALGASLGRRGATSSGPSVVVGQSVIISRSRSQKGETTVRLLSIVPLRQSPQDALASFSGRGNVNDLCKPSGGGSISQSPKPRPEDPEAPSEPPPTPEPSPNDPEEEEDPPSKPFGCNPNDDAQWFNGESCPPGTNSLGFAILPDGSTMTLCRGANTPPGDGCPETPDEYGWVCNSGTCEFVPFGLYATKAECESVCSLPEEEPTPEVPLSGFSCNDGTCSEDTVNPQFETLEACNAARTPVYGDPPFEGGQCPQVYVVNYSAFDSGDNLIGTANVRALGPIGGIRVNPPIVEMFCSNMNFSNPNCGPLANGSPAWRSVGLGGSFTVGGRAQINSVTPCTPPDDCGDPLGPIEGYNC